MNKEKKFWTIVVLLVVVCVVVKTSIWGMGKGYASELDGGWEVATASDYVAGVATFSWSQTIGIWLAAIFTLCIFSFLYKDNPLYKTAESVAVGITAAYWMVVGFWEVIVPNLLGKVHPEWVQSWAMPGLPPVRDQFWWIWLVPLFLGVLLIWRLSPVGSWIARWPLAFIVGTMAGIRMIGFLSADFRDQIGNSVKTLIAFSASDEFALEETIKAIVMLFAMLACLVYFFFSWEHKGVVGKISKVGIWVLMITFGASFALTVMGRIALLAIRLEFLFDDWMWLIDPTDKRIGL